MPLPIPTLPLDRTTIKTASSIIPTEILIPHGSIVHRLPDGAPEELRDDLYALAFPHDEGGWVYSSCGSQWYYPVQERRISHLVEE